MAIDFPSSPTEGQAYSGYRYLNGAWQKSPTGFALPKNYIVNGAMQISQENGRLNGSVSGFYVADQWRSVMVGTGYTPSFSSFDGNLASLSANYLLFNSGGTAKPTLAATDNFAVWQTIEGINLVDFSWGSAAGKPAVLRFTAWGTPGTYAASIRSGGTDRSYVMPFTIDATLKDFVFAIPPCPNGTWPVDNALGSYITFSFATGSSLQTSANQWVSANIPGVTGMSNILAVASQVVRIANVGLYLDPYATGIAPPFEMPNYTAELRACQRYWYRAFGLRGGAAATTQATRIGSPHPVQMRTVPGVSTVGLPKVYDGLATPTLPAATLAVFNTVNTVELSYSLTGLTAGRPALQYWENEGYYIAVSARM